MTWAVAGGVELSRLDKVFWPDEGLTKGDLISYVRRVASVLLPQLRDRPLTVKRYPDGIHGGTFFQKNTPAYAPDWVRTVTLPADNKRGQVSYTLCNDRRTLVWLANQGSIELHPFLSRLDRLDRPDVLLLDIDPPEGRFDLAVQVAMLTRETLARRGIEAWAKTSGAKGVHVIVPLVRRYDFGAVQLAARKLAEEAAAQDPALVTTEFLKAERGGRVFLDATRMGRGAHVVAAYSPRARPGAPVAFPVAWDRLESVSPQDFTIRTVPPLLDRNPDPWKTVSPPRQHLPRDLTGP
jgi:bifunctional non-homologous end joining protein LigD